MPRFIVLLRGVNVGKANRVPMAGLRAMLESLGHTDVKTLLNSGNAVFTSTRRSADALAEAIGAGLRAEFDVTTPVIVLSASELLAIVDGNPIAPPESEHARFLVAFAMAPDRLAALEGLRPLLQPGERLAVTARRLPALRERPAGEPGRGGTAGQCGPGRHQPQLGHDAQVGRTGLRPECGDPSDTAAHASLHRRTHRPRRVPRP